MERCLRLEIDALCLVMVVAVTVARERAASRSGGYVRDRLVLLPTLALLCLDAACCLTVQTARAVCTLISFAALPCVFGGVLLAVAERGGKAFSDGKQKLMLLFPLILHAVPTVIQAVNGSLYAMSENGGIAANAGAWLFMVAPTLYALGIGGLFVTSDPIPRARRVLSLAALAMLLFAACLKLYAPRSPAFLPVLSVLLLLAFLAEQSSDIAESRLMSGRMQSEINNSAVAVMLSQIQPHFLYNALNAIEYLCLKDPQTAHKAIERFAKYLRSNMDSLKQNHLIPFRKELEHLQNYLFIEELRFGARLRVAYDIRTEELWLPPLTIQPLVENAIRYGVMPRPEGGTVTIATKEDGDAALLTISDDGVGFDPMAVQYDGRSHIGISNTRERLQAMCGGDMDIHSVPGEGTSILIRVPKTRE